MALNNIILRVTSGSSNYDLEVESEVPIRVDVSAVEAQTIGEVFSAGTQTFNVPAFPRANDVFRHPYEIGQDNVPGMYNTLPCSVLLDGDTVLEGQLQLKEVIKDDAGYVSYNVEVTDTAIGFKQAIASSLVKDADWSEYDHVLTSQSIVDSWSDQLLSGSVYYPVAHYGFPNGQSASYGAIAIGQSQSADITISNPLTPMQVNQFVPAIKLKDTLDVLFDQVGYRYTGSFTETEDFNKLYLLSKANDSIGPVVDADQEATFQAFTQLPAQLIPMATSSFQNNRIQYTNTFSDPLNAYTEQCPGIDAVGTLNTGSKYTAQASGEHTFQANFGALNPLWISSLVAKCKVSLMKGSLPCNGSAGSGTVITSEEIDLSSAYGFNGFNLALQATTQVTQNEDVWVWVQWYKTGGSGALIDMGFGYFSSQFACTAAPALVENSTINMGEQWNPATKSIDIIKGCLQQFNLVMVPENGNAATIRIENYIDWIRDGRLINWTDKYDTAKRIGITHTIDELERQLDIGNADDVDRFSKLTIENDPNLQYGNLRILADNNISQGEKRIGDFFSPVILAGSTGVNPTDLQAPSTRINEATNFIYPHIYKFENDKLTSYAAKPRIGYKVTQELLSSQRFGIGLSGNFVNVGGSYATIANVSDLPVTSSVSNDLHFNNTYPLFTQTSANLDGARSNYENYWQQQIEGLYWEGSKKITIDLFFEPYEYKQIQLNDRIQIKDQVYLINKISGFNLSNRDIVTVELIKLYPGLFSLPVIPETFDCVFSVSSSEAPSFTPAPVTPSPVTPSPTPAPSTTPSPTPAPSTTPAPVAPTPNLFAVGNYAVPSYQNVEYDVEYHMQGMTKPRTLSVGPSGSCLNDCTYSAAGTFTAAGTGSIKVDRKAPTGYAQDAGSISINVVSGSATIVGDSIQAWDMGERVLYEWDVTGVSTDAVFRTNIIEG